MLQMPLSVSSDISLIFEVSSLIMSPTLDASTTMYQIEDVTFSGTFDVMAYMYMYFEGQKDSMCFSTSNQISEF